MTGRLSEPPSAQALELQRLVAQAWDGAIRVPSFQRPLRWEWRDVHQLFDSIIRRYPIGTLLLWQRKAPAERLTLGALEIDANAAEDALYVVDGQQRVTSLACALHPDAGTDPRFALAYDLVGERLVRPRPNDEPTTVPLPVLFDLPRVLQWFGRHPEVAEYVTTANELTARLRQFPVHVSLITQQDEGVVQDIFDRMNNYGKRLRRSEVFAALNADEHADHGRQYPFAEIAQHVDADRRFGVIDDETVMQAVLARRNPDVGRDIRAEFGNRDTPTARRTVIDFPGEDRDTAYQRAERALVRAVAFLQDEADVPHVAMLAYSLQLVVLTRFFAHFPRPEPRDLRLLRRWYWRTAVTGPQSFKAGTTGMTRAMCGAIVPGEPSGSIQRMLRLVRREVQQYPGLGRFRTNAAATKIVVASWWACHPRSLRTGEVLGAADLAGTLNGARTAREAVREIVPRADVPPRMRDWAANRLLLPDEADDTPDAASGLLRARPDDIDWPAVLNSHALSAEMIAALAAGDTEEFLSARDAELRPRLRRFLDARCEWDFEDTPPLATLDLDEDADAERG